MADRLGDRYLNIKRLGSGSFGEVFRGEERGTGNVRALKIVPLTQSSLGEYKALCGLKDHPNIVTYYKNFRLDRDICLVLEYCSGGNLNDYLLSHDLDLKRESRFMTEIATGVAFLHRNGVIHRDLKPDNILLTADETIKIGDFGLAYIASANRHGGSLYDYYMKGHGGHRFFMAPEVIDGRCSEKTDVFQMGAIFACLLERKTVPSNGETLVASYVEDENGCIVGPGRALHDLLVSCHLDKKLRISRSIRALVEKMLLTQHYDRPSACDVVDALRDVVDQKKQDGGIGGKAVDEKGGGLNLQNVTSGMRAVGGGIAAGFFAIGDLIGGVGLFIVGGVAHNERPDATRFTRRH